MLAILDRTEVAARYLTNYLHKTGLMRKTSVFCENNDHAGRMRNELNNANLDLTRSSIICFPRRSSVGSGCRHVEPTYART
ncbi:hypothetical protein C5E41_31080 [Nocardia nova]|nr:hypothetical protein C5E41_31080 [Nocardia nova]